MKQRTVPLLKILVFLSCLVLPSYQQEIGVDIMPSSHYIMNKQDLQRLRDEVNHDLRRRISNIEESWQANEAIREVSSGVWNMQGSTYPALYNNNGMGGLGQQAMKSYWENYAKAVDPLNYKRKIESQVDETHAENVADKIEEQMTNINEKIGNLKSSIKKSNEAAQSKLETQRPKTPYMPKNEVKTSADDESNTEKKIVDKHKNNPNAEPNETKDDPNKSQKKDTSSTTENTGTGNTNAQSQTGTTNDQQSQTGNTNTQQSQTGNTNTQQSQSGESNTQKSQSGESNTQQSQSGESNTQQSQSGESASFLQKNNDQVSLNGPIQSGSAIYKDIYGN